MKRLKLEEIYAEWEKDSKVDKSELDLEACKIPELHHKYMKILSGARRGSKKMENERNKLYKEKWEFYVEGPTKEQIDKGWEFPPGGKIHRTEVERFLNADPQMIEMNLHLETAREKVKVLESIVQTLNNRGFQIKAAVDFIRFAGGN